MLIDFKKVNKHHPKVTKNKTINKFNKKSRHSGNKSKSKKVHYKQAKKIPIKSKQSKGKQSKGKPIRVAKVNKMFSPNSGVQDIDFKVRPKFKKKRKKASNKQKSHNKTKQNNFQKNNLKRSRKKSLPDSEGPFNNFWYPKQNPRRSRKKKKKVKQTVEPVDNNNIWLIRHLHRLDRDEPSKWKKHSRITQNFLDTPLTEFGKAAAYKAGKEIVANAINLKKIKYIYTSPFTRCIETSLGIAKAITEHTGKPVQLRIEYGLSEAIAVHLEFLKVINQTLFIDKVPILDFKLSVAQIAKDYHPHVDTKYKSLYRKSDITLETVTISAERVVKVMNYLCNNYKNMIICSHQIPVTIANMFLYNRPYPLVYLYKINPITKDKKDNDPKRLSSYGILSGFTKENDRWKYIYSPNNDYIQSVFLDNNI
jgi:broad specificity phosphatase PhoE